MPTHKNHGYHKFYQGEKTRMATLYPFLTPKLIDKRISALWSKLSKAEQKDFKLKSPGTPLRQNYTLSALLRTPCKSPRVILPEKTDSGKKADTNGCSEYDFEWDEVVKVPGSKEKNKAPKKPRKTTDAHKNGHAKVLRKRGKQMVVPCSKKQKDVFEEFGFKNYSDSDTSHCPETENARPSSDGASQNHSDPSYFDDDDYFRDDVAPLEDSPSPKKSSRKSKKKSKHVKSSALTSDDIGLFEDFDTLEKTSLVVEEERGQEMTPRSLLAAHSGFKPNYGAKTYLSFSKQDQQHDDWEDNYSTVPPEVIDKTPYKEPGILVRDPSATKTKRRRSRVSFSDTDLLSEQTKRCKLNTSPDGKDVQNGEDHNMPYSSPRGPRVVRESTPYKEGKYSLRKTPARELAADDYSPKIQKIGWDEVAMKQKHLRTKNISLQRDRNPIPSTFTHDHQEVEPSVTNCTFDSCATCTSDASDSEDDHDAVLLSTNYKQDPPQDEPTRNLDENLRENETESFVPSLKTLASIAMKMTPEKVPQNGKKMTKGGEVSPGASATKDGRTTVRSRSSELVPHIAAEIEIRSNKTGDDNNNIIFSNLSSPMDCGIAEEDTLDSSGSGVNLLSSQAVVNVAIQKMRNIARTPTISLELSDLSDLDDADDDEMEDESIFTTNEKVTTLPIDQVENGEGLDTRQQYLKNIESWSSEETTVEPSPKEKMESKAGHVDSKARSVGGILCALFDDVKPKSDGKRRLTGNTVLELFTAEKDDEPREIFL